MSERAEPASDVGPGAWKTRVGLVFALLVFVLGVTFVTLYRATRADLESGFQRSQEERLSGELGAPVAALIARAHALSTSCVSRDRLRALVSEDGLADMGVAWRGAGAELDALLRPLLDRESSLEGLRVIDAQGRCVVELRRRGIRRPPGLLDGLASGSWIEELERTRTLALGGPHFELVKDAEGHPRLRALAIIEAPARATRRVNARPGALTLVLDASEALALILAEPERRTVAGALYLIDRKGHTLFSRGGAKLGALTDSQRDLVAGSGQRSRWLDGELWSAVDLPGIDRLGWRLVAVVPAMEMRRRVGGRAFWTLALAAVAVALVASIALSFGRARVREVASRERAGYLLRSYEEKERAERFLDSVFNSITDVIVVQDLDYNIIRSNRVAREVYGEALTGSKCYAAYRGKSSMNCRRCPVDATIARGVPLSSEMVHPQTGEVWQIHNFPLHGDDGSVQLVIEHARNITKRRSLEAQLVQSEKLSTLGEMAAGIAHEINNPVGVVSMFAELALEELRQRDDSPELREKIEVIEQHSQQIGKIVKDLLQFARKSEEQRCRVEVQAILDRALAIVELKKMSGEAELRRAGGAGVWVVADDGQLAQVVLNLVVNALHATKGEGQVEVSVERAGPEAPAPTGVLFGAPVEGARVWIKVCDDGAGIDTEQLKRIFDPFFTTKEQGQGTGLGLSVSLGIVQAHGGAIYVETAVGAGAAFTLELPEASVQAS